MKSAKWDMPLSKRAYGKILEKAMIGVRIAGREDDFDDFIETIDLYITKGKVSMPWGDYHDIYDIIFHMIKDDIDTAMRRSREARERAAARRKAREEASDQQEDKKDDTQEDKLAVEPTADSLYAHQSAVLKPGKQAKKRRPAGRRYNDRC
ncbi:MAG: hypothetical protein HFJ91_03885 [Muribaculaceae bacterium]|nr:hypothetical protein [Muribaculaceae bacterium]